VQSFKLNNYQIKKYLKLGLLLAAAAIALASLLYTNNLVEKLKDEERQKAKVWADALKVMTTSVDDSEFDATFPLSVVMANNTIPVIATLQDGSINAYRNLDSNRVDDPAYLQQRLEEMKEANEPIEIVFTNEEKIIIYYENSFLLTKLRYYPYVQLTIIALFLFVSYFAFSYSRRSEQNQVWVGMSKETAHQLGTPISSLVAWLELMKDGDESMYPAALEEMKNDVNRLELITERFSKIGSVPVLTDMSVFEVVRQTVNYLQKRLSSKVEFELTDLSEGAKAPINEPLFAWVIENLTKNAVDAMEGEGKIEYVISAKDHSVILEVSDNGKGIPSNKFQTIFKPGYTTKKRGWGLGLSLVKRIIENYHRGSIIVKESVPGKRTTFKISIH
jgi:signal transduction histidine kinase